ncbi:M20/M25/M40 family metallo-hydrolase [Patescibacteria group bacterium]|nr:M20/M25/M40 family metallo-hydrolase [Patescibacteria group bacterium]MBU4056440.1 M20/M25/M40 family metallo-hydrolase [Patescibacteria group bacterium]MBU4368886.1 M20/M25/M40 family metallo-hydrolase [Patescibacteria group bacterium]
MPQNEILKLAKKLIAFKTMTGDQKQTTACFKFIKNYFAAEIKSKKIIVKEYSKNGLLSMVLSNAITLDYDIILKGHIDVVAAEEKDFIPKIKNGTVCGRGAGDMKSQVAAMMVILKEFVSAGAEKIIALILTSDEETGGYSGAKYLVDEIGYKAKIVIDPDGGNNFALDIKEKGVFWFKITAFGKSSHGSRPWLGENAILKLMAFYQELEKIFPPLKKIKSLYQEGITVNLGKISGGKSINAVPDSAEMYLDIRYSEKSDKQRIINEMKMLTEKFELNFKITDDAEIFETDPNNSYIQSFKSVAKKIIARKVKIIKSTGAGDNRFFSTKGMPVIILGPNFGGEHGPNEWVEIKSLERFYQILKEFIEQID